MRKPVIGILTWRSGTTFSERRYLRQLVTEGQELGAEVYVFAASDINREARTIHGFVPNPEGGWSSGNYPWPEVVIDRCRTGSPEYKRVRSSKLFHYANNKYTNKWNATNLFLQTPGLRKWMPETVDYSPDHLRDMLGRYPLLYIKPGNGTGGRSIIKLTSSNIGYSILARSRKLSKSAASFRDEESLIAWLNRFVNREKIRGGMFMIQQGLDLGIVPGRVADIRLLIQKNSSGEWNVTGYGFRVGPIGSSTSNLHGGGKAVPFEQVIARKFGQEKLESIRKECFDLAYRIVETIEGEFGGMMEFGLDIGVDKSGRVWLIEVNPKPGRDLFLGLKQPEVYRRSCRRPIQYAMYLAKRKTAKQDTTG